MKSILLLVAAAATVSNPTLTPANYTLICDGQQATGFDWSGGKWVQTNFKPARYVVVRSQTNECFDLKSGDGALEGSDGFIWRDVCVNVRRFGDPYRAKASNKCTEYYINREGSGWEVQIGCNGFFTQDFEATIDGEFRRVAKSVIGNLPKSTHRDSMLLEVGICALVS